MPHECTDCGAIYEDGSTQMLEGCESCGGTTFIFTKTAAEATDGTAETDGSGAADGPAEAAAGADEDAAQSRARSDVATADDDPETDSATDVADTAGGNAEPSSVPTAGDDGEDDAIRAAGSERPTAPTEPTDTDTTADDHPSSSSGDSADGEMITPDADEIREELMAQFESIKIVEPGSYELNLMNLYDRDEKIIALQEDGRYQVSLPSALDD